MSEVLQFSPAKRERVGLLIALAGASGSGKTMSALRLAQGLAGDKGRIAFIDTEARRALHYADKFRFDHLEFRPPFKPARFIEAIEAADKAGYDVIVIDSFSHEYDGEGGIIDWADELADKGVKSPGNWKEPKLAHKKLMNKLLQLRASIIFCLRADEKIEIIREGGRTQVRPLGWMPICEKRFMFEMTASFTLIPNQPGKPQFDLAHKLQEQHRPFFPAGKFIGEEAGEMLRAWATGAPIPGAKPSDPPSDSAWSPDGGWPSFAGDTAPIDFEKWSTKFLADAPADHARAWEARFRKTLAGLAASKNATHRSIATELTALFNERIADRADGGAEDMFPGDKPSKEAA